MWNSPFPHSPWILLVRPPKICITLCFPFPLGITVIPRETEDNAYGKFWGANKVYYGGCGNGDIQRLTRALHNLLIEGNWVKLIDVICNTQIKIIVQLLYLQYSFVYLITILTLITTSHEPNRMQMRKTLCSPSLSFISIQFGSCEVLSIQLALWNRCKKLVSCARGAVASW